MRFVEVSDNGERDKDERLEDNDGDGNGENDGIGFPAEGVRGEPGEDDDLEDQGDGQKPDLELTRYSGPVRGCRRYEMYPAIPRLSNGPTV
jgi:hypothetical protein